MGKLQQATVWRSRKGLRAPLTALLAAALAAALLTAPPAAAQSQGAWEGTIVRHEAAETRLVEVINDVRTSLYGLPALANRPFAGPDIDYIECLVAQNRSATRLDHYPSACGRSVQNGGAEVLAWNWNSLGGTTNDLVAAWNTSDDHRSLMLGSGDQVSAGVFCIGSTAYGVAWFRRSDGTGAQGSPQPRIAPPDPYADLFNKERFPIYGDNTFVCDAAGAITAANRPHSDQASTPTTPNPTPPAPMPATVEEVIAARPAFDTDHADVLRLYRAYFSREPDPGGAKYWLDIYDGGESALAIAGHMAGTPEFANTFAGSDDRVFLRTVYTNALGREPDADGFDYWLNLLATSQIDRTETVFYVAFGDEFRTAYPFGGK